MEPQDLDLDEDVARELREDDASEDDQADSEDRSAEETEEAEEPEDGSEAQPRKRRRRRRKVISPAHEARIERYRELVEERGWIFAPPSPPRPVSALFEHLTDTQVESLSA